ncbi:MAG: sigma-70 family RNA polymerase sigma factor [bacterium]
MSTDEQLANRCFAPERDESACAELYEKYRDVATNFARRLLNDAYEAQDAFHNAWYSLLRIRESKPFFNFKAYLFQTVKNHAYMILRKRRTRQAAFPVSVEAHSTNSNADDNPLLPKDVLRYTQEQAKAEREYLNLKLDIESVVRPQLSALESQALAFFLYHGMTYPETAEKVECAEKTVQRARHQARHLLVEYDVFHSKKKRMEL